MLSGVMLIIVTMFAVLGAYYTAELAAEFFAKKQLTRTVLVTMCTDNNGAYDAVMKRAPCRAAVRVVVLCRDGRAPSEGVSTAMRGVHFATKEEAADIICDILTM